jgi:hypothetical protein
MAGDLNILEGTRQLYCVGIKVSLGAAARICKAETLLHFGKKEKFLFGMFDRAKCFDLYCKKHSSGRHFLLPIKTLPLVVF